MRRRLRLPAYAAATACLLYSIWRLRVPIISGTIIERPELACAQSWDTTQMLWIIGYARSSTARRLLQPFGCGREGSRHWRPQLYRSIQRGEVLFVRLTQLRMWVRKILPTLPRRSCFVLVTADAPQTDFTVPSDVLDPNQTHRLLSHPVRIGYCGVARFVGCTRGGRRSRALCHSLYALAGAHRVVEHERAAPCDPQAAARHRLPRPGAARPADARPPPSAPPAALATLLAASVADGAGGGAAAAGG
eukprot:5813063-Prymnesium_polylepis.1